MKVGDLSWGNYGQMDVELMNVSHRLQREQGRGSRELKSTERTRKRVKGVKSTERTRKRVKGAKGYRENKEEGQGS